MSNAATAATPASHIGTKPLLVRRAAVLGAGTMGARIAAHLANAGIPVLLLDLPPKDQIVERALDALAKSKPAAFFEPSRAALITPGTFDDDLPKLAQCDWIIEAVAENLEIKTALLTRVVPHLAAHAILSTNTSGLPIARSSRNPSIASPIDTAPSNHETSWRPDSGSRNHIGAFSRISAARSSNAKKR